MAVFFFSAGYAAGAENPGGAYISTQPPGAEVLLDNEPKGVTPCLVSDLSPGTRYLKLFLPGYRPVVTSIEIEPDKLRDFKYFLEPKYGSVTINTRPGGADIFLDGKYVGRSPRRIEDILAVEHWIRLNRNGYKPWEKEVKLEAEKPVQLDVELEVLSKPREDHKKQKGDCRTECHDLTQVGAKLTVKSQPEGATLFVNEEAKGNTPLTVYLYPGDYKLQVKKSDYIPQHKEITLDFKDERELDFTLRFDRSWKDMVYVPAGEFEMGSYNGAKDELPVHVLYLDAYYIDKYEVTNSQYRRFVKETGYRQPSYQYDRRWGGDDLPVVGVSWEDAAAYAEWAGKRLPTEAEWEKAAKGNALQRYPWGNQWQMRSANTLETGKDGTVMGGSFPHGVAPYGAYDMIGNVWEWCADWYSAAYYRNSPLRNPRGPDKGRTRVIRGGSWQDKGAGLSVSLRNSLQPMVRLNTVGFRCVKNLPW